MPRPGLRIIWLTSVLAAAVLAGCGSSGSTGSQAKTSAAPTTTTTATSPAPTTSQSKPAPASGTSSSAKGPVEDITLKSSTTLNPIAARYTCDGPNVSLPLHWSKVPGRSAELDLFVLSALPINGKFVIAWAVAGLRPKTRTLSSTHLPPGAIVGRNSFGHNDYSVCPAKGSSGSYAVLLYAVPHKIPVKPGFDAEALVEGTLVHAATSQGELFFSYHRP